MPDPLSSERVAEFGASVLAGASQAHQDAERFREAVTAAEAWRRQVARPRPTGTTMVANLPDGRTVLVARPGQPVTEQLLAELGIAAADVYPLED